MRRDYEADLQYYTRVAYESGLWVYADEIRALLRLTLDLLSELRKLEAVSPSREKES